MDLEKWFHHGKKGFSLQYICFVCLCFWQRKKESFIFWKIIIKNSFPKQMNDEAKNKIFNLKKLKAFSFALFL